MKNTLNQIFHSGKFVVGFVIFAAMLLTVIIYPLVVTADPLGMLGLGTFFKPGTYVSIYDSVSMDKNYTLKMDGASDARLAAKLSSEDREEIKAWLVKFGLPESEIDTADTEKLLGQWWDNYDSSLKFKGMTSAKRKYYQRLDKKLDGIFESGGLIIADKDPETGELTQSKVVEEDAYVNVSEVANVKRLLLGTDNFGRDVLTELVSACGTSMLIGLIAGVIATIIGLTFGLISGYAGGFVDDIIMFLTNLFTVIPSFVLLILISFSIGQEQRGAIVVAIVIGLTSWAWTARAVRAQVISLRNRDHVNMSKLSGHSMVKILLNDILPYIASYVVMALILQISTAILAEAQLSMLGLGPKTTEVPTLGLMMYWAMAYTAHLNGAWWAYFPVIITIALISFSLNLMNTGLDQVFNPTLRD